MQRLARLRAKLAQWRRENDDRVACGPGCGGRCCTHSAIECSRAEAEAIAQVLPAAAWGAVLAVADLRDESQACPLSIAGHCSAYEVRPVYCRTWHVSAETDPKTCGNADAQGMRIAPQLVYEVRRYLGAKPPGPVPRRWLNHRLHRIAQDFTTGVRAGPPGFTAAARQLPID